MYIIIRKGKYHPSIIQESFSFKEFLSLSQRRIKILQKVVNFIAPSIFPRNAKVASAGLSI
jgi:hypothetical protein